MRNRYARRRDALVVTAALIFFLFQVGMFYYMNSVRRERSPANATYEIASDGTRTPIEPVVSAVEKSDPLPDALRRGSRILLIVGAILMLLNVWVVFRLAFRADSIRSFAFTFRFAWGILAFGLLEVFAAALLGLVYGFGNESTAASIFPLANCGAFLIFFGVLLRQRAANERDKRDERKLDILEDYCSGKKPG